MDETKIIDLSIPELEKKVYRINGDQNKIIKIDPSDSGIVDRAKEMYPKLDELQKKYVKLADSTPEPNEDGEYSDEASNKFLEGRKTIDLEMREAVNYIFDYDVCSVCVPQGSMYDVIGGKFRFEYIVDTLANLYSNHFDEELKNIKARTAKYTNKYTNKYTKPKTTKKK